MSVIDRYLGLRVGWGFLFALVSLLALFSIVDFLNELEKVGTGRYDVAQAVHVLLLELPSKAYDLFPVAALLGTATALGILTGRNEIVALSSAGVSRARLVRPIMEAGVVVVAVMVLLGELVAAPLLQRAETRRSIALSGGLALQTANGFWASSGTRFVNVRNPVAENDLRDISIYEIDHRHRMHSFVHAGRASHGPRGWLLEDVVESRFTKERVVTKHLVMRASRALPSSEQLWLSLFPREDLSFADLRRQLTSLRARGENALRYESAFWFRLIMPFSTLVMMFVAVPLVLAAPRATSLGQRIVLAALGGIGFDLLARTFMQLGLVYGWGPVPSAVLPAAVALGLASWAFRGVP